MVTATVTATVDSGQCGILGQGGLALLVCRNTCQQQKGDVNGNGNGNG
jgi:hypothetical protein